MFSGAALLATLFCYIWPYLEQRICFAFVFHSKYAVSSFSVGRARTNSCSTPYMWHVDFPVACGGRRDAVASQKEQQLCIHCDKINYNSATASARCCRLICVHSTSNFPQNRATNRTGISCVMMARRDRRQEWRRLHSNKKGCMKRAWHCEQRASQARCNCIPCTVFDGQDNVRTKRWTNKSIIKENFLPF